MNINVTVGCWGLFNALGYLLMVWCYFNICKLLQYKYYPHIRRKEIPDVNQLMVRCMSLTVRYLLVFQNNSTLLRRPLSLLEFLAHDEIYAL